MEKTNKMARFSIVIFAILVATVTCQFPFFGRRWKPNSRRVSNCRVFGMKPVVNHDGKVTQCVFHCESEHSNEYSFRHGHHCKEIPLGCKTSDCSICETGYYNLFDHGKTVCVDYCPDHHEEQNGRCVEIPRECRDYHCTECVAGYFYWPYPVFYGNRCRRNCPYGYSKDKENNSCEKEKGQVGCADLLCYKCKNGFLKHVDKYYRNKCLKKCPDGYAKMKNRCREIPAGCLNLDCTECKDGFFQLRSKLFNFHKCRRDCPSGYFADRKQKLCVRCSDENCVHCSDSASKCDECRVPYALLQGEKENVTKCTSKCPDGFKISYTYDWLMFVCQRDREIQSSTAAPTEPTVTSEPTEPTVTNETTKPTTAKEVKTAAVKRTTSEPKTFPPGCKDQFCITCADGYFRLLTIGNGLKCLKKCPPGYFNISNDCIFQVTKPDPVPEGCEDKECRLPCKDGFYKLSVIGHGLKCVKNCPLGYFTALKDCIACHEPRCKNCDESPFRCESCKDGFITFKGHVNDTVQCLDRCPKGYERIIVNGTAKCEKKLIPECTIENCETCADHELRSLHVGCVECKAGYLLRRDIFKDECVAVCPDGFYAGEKPGTGISACLNCDVQFCQQCVKRKKCTKCFEPFVFDYKNGQCIQCKYGTFYNRATRTCKPVPSFGGVKKNLRSKKPDETMKKKKKDLLVPSKKKKTEETVKGFVIN